MKIKKVVAGILAFSMLCGVVYTDNSVISEMVNTVSVSALDIDVTDKGSEGDFYCEYCSDGSIIITGYSGNETSLTIPSKINGYTVKYLIASSLSWGNLVSIDVSNNIVFLNSYTPIPASEAADIFKSIGISVTGGKADVSDLINTKCGENCTFSLDSDGTLTISGTGDMYDFDFDNVPPWSSSSVKSIIIEDGVTSIGNRAFYCKSLLTKIVIPDSVVKVGDYAFMYCQSLTEIKIPNSVKSIGRN